MCAKFYDHSLSNFCVKAKQTRFHLYKISVIRQLHYFFLSFVYLLVLANLRNGWTGFIKLSQADKNKYFGHLKHNAV